MSEFHLQHFDPCEPHWPRGGWSVYQISGDQIAERVEFKGVWPDRKAIRRDSWCGYLGIYETLEDATKAIQTAETERK